MLRKWLILLSFSAASAALFLLLLRDLKEISLLIISIQVSVDNLSESLTEFPKRMSGKQSRLAADSKANETDIIS